MEAPAADGEFAALLDTQQLELLAERGRPVRFPAGASLLHQGEPGDRVMLLRSGRVKIAYATEEGRDVILGFRGGGDLIGELGLIDDGPRVGTAMTIEPVEALVIAAGEFNALLASSPELSRALLVMLARRFRDAERKRIEFARSDAVGRVAARLLELADRYGTAGEHGIEVELPLSQEELAGWCGCSREAVVKALHSLRAVGWLETGRMRATILDEQALRARSA